ncbi:hypothetical protein BUE76_03645 [Cnuella takakiae]|nr:hypothetical protein BUE76_03645 [Cnuella takakiae]
MLLNLQVWFHAKALRSKDAKVFHATTRRSHGATDCKMTISSCVGGQLWILESCKPIIDSALLFTYFHSVIPTDIKPLLKKQCLAHGFNRGDNADLCTGQNRLNGFVSIMQMLLFQG